MEPHTPWHVVCATLSMASTNSEISPVSNSGVISSLLPSGEGTELLCPWLGKWVRYLTSLWEFFNWELNHSLSLGFSEAGLVQFFHLKCKGFATNKSLKKSPKFPNSRCFHNGLGVQETVAALLLYLFFLKDHLTVSLNFTLNMLFNV